MPHANAETQASYLDAKGAYAVRQTCTCTCTCMLMSGEADALNAHILLPRRLNLQCTSLTLSVFAHSFTPFSFSNAVLAKLTIDTFTGMCRAVFLHLLKY